MKIFVVWLSITITFSVNAERYKKSDHFDGNKFHNLDNNELNSFFDLIKWQLTRDKAIWPDSVTNTNYPFRPIAPQEKVSATFINHATFFVQLPGINILTDPIFTERASPVGFAGPKRIREPGIQLDDLPPTDVVIISHNHYDHLDLETLVKLDAKYRPLFVVPLGDEKLLRRKGIQNIKELDWWEEVRVKDTRIIFTPAKHWSSRTLLDKNKSLWGSFMIDNGTSKVYFAGDTGYSSHFELIKNRVGIPDLALMPIGAYEPRWFMKHHHMNPDEAVKAHVDIGAVRSIAMHFGTFQMADEGIDRPVRDLGVVLQKEKIDPEEFRVLDEGQALSF